MATKSPLARVKEEFGGKDKLVDKIVGLLGSGDEPKDDMRRRLLGAANSKLVRLHGIATQVKDLGGKDQLASAAATELGRAKDQDYVTKLGTYSSGRLVDILQSARKRNKRKGLAATVRTTGTPGSATEHAAPRLRQDLKKDPKAAKQAKPANESKTAKSAKASGKAPAAGKADIAGQKKAAAAKKK